MTFKVIKAEEVPIGGIVADRRLYLAADQLTMIEEGDPKVASLLVSAGGTIPGEQVKKLDLRVVDGHVVQGAGISHELEERTAAEMESRQAEEAARKGHAESLARAKEKAIAGLESSAEIADVDQDLAGAKSGGPGGALEEGDLGEGTDAELAREQLRTEIRAAVIEEFGGEPQDDEAKAIVEAEVEARLAEREAVQTSGTPEEGAKGRAD